jgi:hypothetical protein
MRKLVLVGTTALALATSGAFASGAGASGASHPASLAASLHGKAVASPKVILAGKCRTAIGSELPTPDGLIAWNDTSGTSFDTAGAADFRCGPNSTRRGRTIHQVTVNGYFGQVEELFNVTFYSNDPTNGSNEPADAGAYCTYTNVPGTAGGQYPQHVTTVLTLPTRCIAKRGINWVSVQNNNSAGPWYWEMQVERPGSSPDWIDRHDAFGSGCTTWSNDRYLFDCLGFDYGDFMLVLN